MGRLGAVLGAEWAQIAFGLDILSHLKGLGPSWERLEGPLGLSWGRLGRVLGASWAVLERLGGVSEASWNVLEASWAGMGAIF